MLLLSVYSASETGRWQQTT